MLIIDGNNLAIRAYFGYSYQINTIEVGMLYGFLDMLRKYIKKFKPDYVFAVFDGGHSRRRKKIYKQYKVKERTMEDKIRLAIIIEYIDIIKSILPYFKIKPIFLKGVEGDDLIYTLCKIYKKVKRVVVSSDIDFLQLLKSFNLSIYLPTKEIYVNKKNFVEIMGVYPIEFLFMRAVVGDRSDRIDGISGIGEKTIKKVIERNRDKFADSGIYKSIENLKVFLNNLELINKREQLLLNQEEKIYRNIQLMDLSKEYKENLKDIVKKEIKKNKKFLKPLVKKEIKEKKIMQFFYKYCLFAKINDFSEFIRPFKRLK